MLTMCLSGGPSLRRWMNLYTKRSHADPEMIHPQMSRPRPRRSSSSFLPAAWRYVPTSL